jgi:cation:H+ antiporter
MTITILMLLVSFLVILAGCETFANSVELVGRRANLSHAAAGSLLAAVGTALPESLIPVIAVIFGGTHGEEIGIGAILGAPFLLTSLAFFLVGVTLYIMKFLKKRETAYLKPDLKAIIFELKYFIFIIPFVFLISLTELKIIHIIGGIILLVLYALYARHFMKHECEIEEEYTDFFMLNKFFRITENWVSIIAQLVIGLILIVVGAKLFVQYISLISETLNVSPLLLSLIIAPLATELPEKYNSVTWTFKKKDTLAFANITGAMNFQSMIPVCIGLFFTQWKLGLLEMITLTSCFLSASIVFLTIKWKNGLPGGVLLIGGFFYITYLIIVFKYIM